MSTQIKKAKLFLPLDVPTLIEGGERLVKLARFYDVVKVGFELMSSVGQPVAINLPKVFGCEVWADTKYYDIPNTVYKAAKATTSHGVAYFNVMAEGKRAMMEAAMEGAHERAREWGIKRPKIIAVTILTSDKYEDLLEKGMVPKDIDKPKTPKEQQDFITYIVMKLAKRAVSAGVDCLLSSPLEAPEMIKRWPDKEVMTPGIRNPDSKLDDQNRKMSPYEARMKDITGYVIGRLISEPPEGKTMEDMARLVRQDIARAEAELGLNRKNIM
ncbi:orotidine 5'-phosphate decarboxylase [Candidatus Parcubacteria bacterium]|nr:orotidine 5'-phosphate decarboxylase [Candidatus Parcubacteria bacterium]